MLYEEARNDGKKDENQLRKNVAFNIPSSFEIKGDEEKFSSEPFQNAVEANLKVTVKTEEGIYTYIFCREFKDSDDQTHSITLDFKESDLLVKLGENKVNIPLSQICCNKLGIKSFSCESIQSFEKSNFEGFVGTGESVYSPSLCKAKTVQHKSLLPTFNQSGQCEWSRASFSKVPTFGQYKSNNHLIKTMLNSKIIQKAENKGYRRNVIESAVIR